MLVLTIPPFQMLFGCTNRVPKILALTEATLIIIQVSIVSQYSRPNNSANNTLNVV